MLRLFSPLARATALFHRLAVPLLFTSACINSYASPTALVPMFTRAGQAEVGVAIRPLAPRRALDVQAMVAPTRHLRLGLTLNGALMRYNINPMSGLSIDAAQRLVSGYAEGSLGLEGDHGRWRYGAMAGAGYGVSDYGYDECVTEPRGSDSFGCETSERRDIYTRYTRAYLQPYLGLASRKLWSIALGVRVLVDHDLERTGAPMDTRPGADPFVSNNFVFGKLRLEIQVMYSESHLLHLHLAVRRRIDPAK